MIINVFDHPLKIPWHVEHQFIPSVSYAPKAGQHTNFSNLNAFRAMPGDGVELEQLVERI